MKKIFLLLFLVVFFTNLASATGTCALDKTNYIPGETASFECSCSVAGEENAVGNIVWRNSTGFVLQNVSANSGSCRTSFFGNSFNILSNSTLYTGNVTFETASVPWQGGDDVVSDNFAVINYTAFDCLIENVVASSSIKVGGYGSLKFEVKDPTSNESIVHASCSVEADTLDGSPVVFSPDGPGNDGYKMTNADGHVGFTHHLTENFWTKNTSYSLEMHCFSLPNNTFAELEHIGWLGDSGNAAGMKSCNAEILFTTNGVDLRPENDFNAGEAVLYVGFFFILVFLIVAGFVGIGLLPPKNTVDEEGKILSVSYLKYFRNVLWLVEWVLIMGLTYIASNLAFYYLSEELFAKVLFSISMIMFAGLPIIVTVWLIWFFRTFFHDKQFQNMLNRGIFPQGRNF